MASEEDSYSTITLKGTPVAELRVTDMKRELEKRGLSKSGSKTQLIERLKAVSSGNAFDKSGGIFAGVRGFSFLPELRLILQ